MKTDRYKGVSWIISSLTDIVAKGGNFMVGIGPDGMGRFDPKVIQALKEAGQWLKVNGEAIYSTRPREADRWKEGETIRYTRTKDRKTVYAIIRAWPGNHLRLKSVEPVPGTKIYMLGYQKPLNWVYNKTTGLDISLPAELQVIAKRPCKLAWSFRISSSN